ncbi:MAG: MYXO-CTERM domain-containing protein [Cognaticolwellia sp.]|jgi:MYXO-CTERM domain-containing protein
MLLVVWTLSLAALASPDVPKDEPISNVSPCPTLSESLDALETAGLKHAYDCVAESDQALPDLLERIAAQPERETLTRALAVWRMHRLDEGITDEESRAYNGGDRRLLTDAIKARKGRKSVVQANEAIFTQMGWYDPASSYTDGRLDDMDRGNIDLLRTPAALPEPEEAPDLGLVVAEKVHDTNACGCSSQPGAGSLWGLVGLVGLLALRRRDR